MPRNCLYALGWLLCCLFVPPTASEAIGQEPIADWTFVPEYQLLGKAANHPGPRIPYPKGQPPLVDMDTASLRMNGQQPTQRLRNLLPKESIPRDQFTVEAWIVHHVNQPVGMLIAAKGKLATDSIPWALGFNNWTSSFTMQGKDGAMVELQSRMKRWGGFKERWVHLVATYDGHKARVWVNGEMIGSGHLHHDDVQWPEQPEFEMASYMKREPFMQFANLVHRVRIYDKPLTEKAIQSKYLELQKPIEEARLYDGLFHFTAGPYLNFAQQNSMNLLWETDRKSTAKIEWGTTAKLGQQVEIDASQRLHTVTLKDLAPNTSYFYRVTSIDGADPKSKIDSGILTFKTAVEKNQPFRFAVIGDTEARPHVNDRLAKQIWGERPNFLNNVGDLTDAGKRLQRYEWTHEYFVGMNQLTSRIPMFAVPGNGEGDLVWYNHYHHYPEPENFYKFEYGDAAFFMLDSNQREKEFQPGGKQYEWLKKQIQDCDARWKFVCHHHATYTGEEDDYGDTWKEGSTFGDPFVRKIVPLYEEFGVDMVLFGHLHLYERSHPIKKGKVDFEAGVIHVLAGGGGGNLEDFAPTPAFFSAKTHRGHHYLIIESQNESLTMRMYDTDGDIRDSLQLTKQGKRTRVKRLKKD